MSSHSQVISVGPQEYSQFLSQIDALVARFAALSLSDPVSATSTTVPSTAQYENTFNDYLPQLDANDLWAMFTQDLLPPPIADADTGALPSSAETEGNEEGGEGDDVVISQWAPLCL
ncbi:hypothetical protein EC991_002948 [Linnemannia zychae]|nr:hypothetical protein EC991_002948 [Linnemannia zychae]